MADKENKRRASTNVCRRKFGHRKKRVKLTKQIEENQRPPLKDKNENEEDLYLSSDEDDGSEMDTQLDSDWTPETGELVHDSNSYTSAILSLDLMRAHMKCLGEHTRTCDGSMQYLQDGMKDGISLDMKSSCSCGWTSNVASSTVAGSKPQVNIACTVGCINAGIGSDKLNSIFAAMGCPTFRSATYDSYEESVGVEIEKFAQKDMEERRELEWYGAGVGEGEVADITVVGDGGWGKRSLGHSYDSPTGCAVVIGAETQKVLDLDVRCKTCTPCKRKLPHDLCYKNHTGSSGSMESTGMVTMFNRSLDSKLRYTTYIGDGDSSVETCLKTEVCYGSSIIKVDCINHKIKNLKKNLKLIQKENKCRKVLTDHIINRICNSVTSAVRLRRSQGISTENTIKLAGDIRNCVNHVFGDHSKCADDFCKADSDVVTEPVSSTIITKIKIELQKVAAKPQSLIQQKTSNLAETFMKVRSTIDGNKAVNRGQRGAWSHRCMAAVLKYNRGLEWISDFLEECFSVETASASSSYISYMMEKRANDAATQKAPLYKQKKIKQKYSSKELKDQCKDYGPNCEMLDRDISADDLKEAVMSTYDTISATIPHTEQGSSTWLDERRLRVTSSNFGKICKRRATNPRNLVKALLYTLWSGNAATQYGHDMEPKIELDLIKQKPGLTVTHPSLTAHPKHKFIAGSPDGIGLHNGERFLIEYKAPYSLYLAEKPACEAACLTTDSTGLTTLKRTHDFFYQIQGMLEVFDLPFCILAIAGFDDFFYTVIYRDQSFFDTKIFPQLKRFYFGAIMPELVYPMKRRGGIREVVLDF